MDNIKREEQEKRAKKKRTTGSDQNDRDAYGSRTKHLSGGDSRHLDLMSKPGSELTASLWR